MVQGDRGGSWYSHTSRQTAPIDPSYVTGINVTLRTAGSRGQGLVGGLLFATACATQGCPAIQSTRVGTIQILRHSRHEVKLATASYSHPPRDKFKTGGGTLGGAEMETMIPKSLASNLAAKLGQPSPLLLQPLLLLPPPLLPQP